MVSLPDRVLDAMADAVIAGDPDGRITLWNAGAEALFGWRAEEVVGGPLLGIPDEKAAAEHVAALERVAAGAQVSLATKRKRADGSVVDVWIVLCPLRNESDGSVDSWIAVARDATSQRAVQRELRRRVELVERLAAVVASVNSDLDLPTVLQRISESGAELLTADAAAYVVIADKDLVVAAVSGLPAHLIGERIPLAESGVAQLLATGRTSGTVDNRDYPDATPIIAATAGHLPRLAVALTRLDGEPSGALYVFFAAQRRGVGRGELGVLELLADAAGTALGNARAYDRLRRQREHERAVIDATADGVAVLDALGVVRHWNPAARELTGIAEPDALGQPLPFAAPEPGVVVEHQLDSGRWLEVLSSPIAETAETVVDFRDITRAKAVEASKDLFLAVASHELRTPITVVQGYASTLVQHWNDLTDADRRDSVERIAERTRALASLVEQLLLGSRAGSAAPVPAVPFDLGALLRSGVAGFRTLTTRHDLVVEVAEDLPRAVGDPSSVEVVIGQLLENAVKYSPAGGEVVVGARRDKAEAVNQIVMSVCDRGIGITPDEVAYVFDRFYQVGGERRRFGGVGLGLYIVRKLVEAQGGTVRATPREGGGTCFEVRLPAVQ